MYTPEFYQGGEEAKTGVEQNKARETIIAPIPTEDSARNVTDSSVPQESSIATNTVAQPLVQILQFHGTTAVFTKMAVEPHRQVTKCSVASILMGASRALRGEEGDSFTSNSRGNR